MKREIKFRAWLGHTMEHQVLSGQLGNFFAYQDPKDTACAFNTRYRENVPVMQFTGLKDKNGVEIFEGDILKAIDVLLTVWYNDATASFDVLHYGDETGDTESLYSNIEAGIPIEVIGNIYEDSKLLTDSNAV